MDTIERKKNSKVIDKHDGLMIYIKERCLKMSASVDIMYTAVI